MAFILHLSKEFVFLILSGRLVHNFSAATENAWCPLVELEDLGITRKLVLHNARNAWEHKFLASHSGIPDRGH